MIEHVDVLVIGAGPAGLCTATEAARAGLRVVVLDEQPRPGGQIWRAIETAEPARAAILGPDYRAGRAIAAEFRASGADYRPGAQLWNISSERVADYSRNGSSARISADKVVVATGALERPSPLPGWTLPGVTTAGALQILLKSAGIVPEGAVIAGSGPLIWLIAAQLVAAGAPPRAVVDTTPRGRLFAARRHIGAALRGHAYLRKGLGLIARVRRAGVPVYRHAEALEVEGTSAAEALRFRHRGRPVRIATEAVALHQGVVPNQQLTRLLRCAHMWDARQACFRPVLDARFQSSVPGVHVVGDGGGIAGATSAALQGRILGLMLAAEAGRGIDTRALAALRRKRAADEAVRPFLEACYAPADWILAPADNTLVCRCEEVTAGTIRATVATGGVAGPNQLKALLRTGMGPCQGRVCGLAVTAILAASRGTPPALDDYYRVRPPLKPLTIGELAADPAVS